MKRRNFVKQSIAGAIIAATPLALTGLVRAEGGGGTGSTSTDSTDWWDTTSTTEETSSSDTTFDTTALGGCADYIRHNPDSAQSFKYRKQGADGKDHMYCYKEFQCDNTSPTSYCLDNWQDSNGVVHSESDCGVVTLGKTGNPKCDPLDKKEPGDDWP
jgi:hypothetical protein